MKKALLTTLRNKETDTSLFRDTAHKMAHLLAEETLGFVKEKEVSVETPLAKTKGYNLDQKIVLIPILRAGLAFLPAFLFYFEKAKVGFVGLKRDEKTAVAKEYYRNIPHIDSDDLVIVLDPMIATGGSAVSAIQLLIDSGVKEDQIIFVSLLGAPEGVNLLNKKFPKVKLILETKDEGLSKDKFIVPGFGDFGDRYFGTL